ncbi:hypothetical protein GCM10009555_053820 [Acrocarpospora macrocephala]|uniref:Pyridoxamine 5'-phosphate oxidase n=1 Tax=Acrocarpospora macrocephala TaxID=150177 RepID=A0A5M3WP31_9ACTN|nr:pyridoxamine 5'-phosphate oxidase family protein [Acrocarpospora macrocephala]GES11077.1 hypothetical protein Amac_046740 [Acrocarpospora macrocephala]
MTSRTDPASRLTRHLPREEALRLLEVVRLGRIVFVSRAVPAIRLVTHTLTDGRLVIGAAYDAELASVLVRPGLSHVVYQTDRIDPATQLGWSITLTGRVALIQSSGELDQLTPRLHQWNGQPCDLVAWIHPELLTGTAVEAITNDDAAADSPR